MTIERQHERRRPTQQPPQPDGPQLEAPGDAAEVARAAAASAADVQATPAGIDVTIRTTTSRTADVVRVVATPETPIAELMDEACNQLEVEDQSRYVLVSGGEVLGDGSRPVGDLVGDRRPPPRLAAIVLGESDRCELLLDEGQFDEGAAGMEQRHRLIRHDGKFVMPGEV